jgi:16S rRNA (guanine(966)-N(2))-methyltransferase RsmD
MRIISGTARGRKLVEFSGRGIRPTPDRVREALFSILASRFGSFAGLRVLELFAGSGAQSLEALSRGAQTALLVDASPQACQVIEENIQRCRCPDRARVLRGEALSLLPELTAAAPFQLILLDPPYHQGLIPQALAKIDSLQLLADDGIICAESASDEIVTSSGRLKQLESRRYGSTTIHLFGRQASSED